MDFNFIVDKKFLAAQIIYRSFLNENFQMLENNILKNNSFECENIKDLVEQRKISHIYDSKFDDFFNSLINTNEFKRAYEETLNYLKLIEITWGKNKRIVNKYLRETLRLKNINICIDSYITHPKAKAGYSDMPNTIRWGHYKGLEEPIYNIVYLVHEGLHCLLPYKEGSTFEEKEIHHSIIELISDNELYSKLSDENMYDNYQGHDRLKFYKQEILEDWFNYLNFNGDFSSMDIKGFIDYCNRKYSNIKNLK